MGFLDEAKSIVGDLKGEFDDTTDPYDRMELRITAFVVGFIALVILIGVIVLLANIAAYLIPGLVVAGGVYWYFARYNKGDKNKDKPDFRKN